MPIIEVVQEEIGTVVRVTGFAAVSGSIRIDSSSIWSPTAPLDLTKADLEAIAMRLANSGKQKGRVLYARHVPQPPVGSPVVAVLCMHIDTGIARIEHTAGSKSLFALQAKYAIVQLIECMKQIASKHGCGCVEWVFHSEQGAKACCKTHGFRPVARRGTRYAGLRKNAYLVELRF